MVEFIAMFPHPPIAVPEVGGAETAKVNATEKAMENLAQEIAAVRPQVIVAISPHGHVFSDAITITALSVLEGDLGQFGASGIKMAYPLAEQAADFIRESCRGSQISCYALDKEILRKYKLSMKLDHGLVVPFSFLKKAGWQGEIVPVNMAFLPYEELYHFGKLLNEGMEKLGKKWVLLVSGDMSHRLTADANAGYSPQGAVFDNTVRQCLARGDVRKILDLDPELIEEAGECALRPLVMGLGVLDGYEMKTRELSYEGPFGVGYLVCKIEAGSYNKDREYVEEFYKRRKEHSRRGRIKESEPVRLARESIHTYLTTGKQLKAAQNEQGLFAQQAGAFVSLKKHRRLRGCIGTIEPTQENLGQEIIKNALSAALHDPRFEPLQIEELEDVTISVDVLEKPEAIDTTAQLDPKRYGVIVTRGNRRGLLLPDLPGIENAAEQVRIAKEKAGIMPQEKVALERFRVTRYV